VAEKISKCLLTNNYKVLSGFSRLPGEYGYAVKILADSVNGVNSIKVSLIRTTKKVHLAGLS
jgi:hypothetical protein